MVRLDADTPGYRFVAWNDTAIVAWLSPPTIEGIAKMYSFLAALAAQQHGKIYVFAVIAEFSGVPDSEARQAMAESMAKTAGITNLVISVVEGVGFRAAAIRSISSAMQLLARRTAPMKVVADTDSGIDALLKDKRLSGLLDREELARAVRLARVGS